VDVILTVAWKNPKANRERPQLKKENRLSRSWKMRNPELGKLKKETMKTVKIEKN
jgi:hypothetical protein